MFSFDLQTKGPKSDQNRKGNIQKATGIIRISYRGIYLGRVMASRQGMNKNSRIVYNIIDHDMTTAFRRPQPFCSLTDAANFYKSHRRHKSVA